AQPPIMIPYTLTERTANTYSMATLISAACKTTFLPPISNVSPQGITAEVIKAMVIEINGPNTNKNVLGVFGINSSLANSFKPSAKSCSIPPVPARFGPLRSCIHAAILRSAKVQYMANNMVIAKTATMITLFSIMIASSIINCFYRFYMELLSCLFFCDLDLDLPKYVSLYL